MSEFTPTVYCHNGVTLRWQKVTLMMTPENKWKTWWTHKIYVWNSIPHNEGTKHEYSMHSQTCHCCSGSSLLTS